MHYLSNQKILKGICCWTCSPFFWDFFILHIISKVFEIYDSDVKLRFMYQNRPSKLHQLPFDQGVQIVFPPRSTASVRELIGTPSDGILYRYKLLFISSIQEVFHWWKRSFDHSNCINSKYINKKGQKLSSCQLFF